MTLYEQMDREIPDYYDGMHRDGYNADIVLRKSLPELALFKKVDFLKFF